MATRETAFAVTASSLGLVACLLLGEADSSPAPVPSRSLRPMSSSLTGMKARLDGALLNVWGRISSHLLSVQYRKQFDEVVKGAENLAQQLAVLPDDRLRQAADELRHRFLSSNRNADRTALAFALAREAARRHTGMRHFRVFSCSAAPP